jgi:hypothetical protein
MRPKQVPLQTLVGEEAILTFLAIEWWSVVNHLGVNLQRIIVALKSRPAVE